MSKLSHLALTGRPLLFIIESVDKLGMNDHRWARATNLLHSWLGLLKGMKAQVFIIAITSEPDCLTKRWRQLFDQRLLLGLPDSTTRAEAIKKELSNLIVIRAQSNITKTDILEIAGSSTEGFLIEDIDSISQSLEYDLQRGIDLEERGGNVR